FDLVGLPVCRNCRVTISHRWHCRNTSVGGGLQLVEASEKHPLVGDILLEVGTMGVEVLRFGVLNHKNLLICRGGLALASYGRGLFAALVATTTGSGSEDGTKRRKG